MNSACICTSAPHTSSRTRCNAPLLKSNLSATLLYDSGVARYHIVESIFFSIVTCLSVMCGAIVRHSSYILSHTTHILNLFLYFAVEHFRYKKIVDNNGKTGRGAKHWQYYSVMDTIMAGDPSVQPLLTLGSLTNGLLSRIHLFSSYSTI